MNAETLFRIACELPITERAAYLDRACADQPQLRQQVEAMLAAHPPVVPEGITGAYLPDESGVRETRTSDFAPIVTQDLPLRNEQKTHDFAPSSDADSVGADDLGTVIAGRYRLIKVLGEGGMGTVYIADQSEPVKRQVALKLIKAGMDSRIVLARFEAERQALALMDHPNIARIYDGGLTPQGQPFFVMELVRGVPLTDYCDTHRMPVRARLELMTAVCQAVQHAHQKGIIHRDLKPGNILITEVDGRPTPKVIDFGVAKATEQHLADLGFSDEGAIVGTPAYMSPEQTDPDMDIDTRSDVYALGVILYELLVGSPPIESRDFKRGAVMEMLRMVRDVQPPKPSTKLSAAEQRPNIAANRSIEPLRLLKMLQGELDWIILKALEKDRNRRYESANGLARDLQRFLADEVVEARPASASYHLQKFVRRNWLQVSAAGIVFLALFGGIIGTSWQAYRADQARADEAQQRSIAEDNAREANRQTILAREARDAEAEQRSKAETKEREAVAASIAERLAKEQALKRLLQVEKGNQILGSIFDHLDIVQIREGNEPLESILGKRLVQAAEQIDIEAIGDPIIVAALQSRLGYSLSALGFYPEAKSLLEKALVVQTDKLGKDHAMTMNTFRELAQCYRRLGGVTRAIPMLESIHQQLRKGLPVDHPDAMNAEINLAMAYLESGDHDKAIPMLESVHDRMIAKLGTDHEMTIDAISKLAQGYLTVRRLDEAVPLLDEAYQRTKVKYGDYHPFTLSRLLNLTAGYRQTKQYTKALPLLEEAHQLTQQHLGSEHPYTLSAVNSLAVLYQSMGKMEQAIPLFQQGIQRMIRKRGPEHPETLVAMNNLAATCWSMKKLDQSIPLFEKVLKAQIRTLGRQHPQTQATISNLGINYKDARRYAEAIPLLQECHEAAAQNPRLRHIGLHLLEAYLNSGDAGSALKLFPQVMADIRKRTPPNSPQMVFYLSSFGSSFLEIGEFSTAERLLLECLEICEDNIPDEWTTFNTMSMYGGSLLGQKKFAAAERLLVKGYLGLKERNRDIPPAAVGCLPDALIRLITLSSALNRPADVAKYCDEIRPYVELIPAPMVIP